MVCDDCSIELHDVRVSARVCDDCSNVLHVACKRSRRTWLSKCKRNCFIARRTLRYCKRNRVRLWSYPDLDCLRRWKRSAESQGSNAAANNYIETVSYLCHHCREVQWVHCKNKRMWSKICWVNKKTSIYIYCRTLPPNSYVPWRGTQTRSYWAHNCWMKDFHISKNLDSLRLSPCARNRNIHVQNWGRGCLKNCCWTGVCSAEDC